MIFYRQLKKTSKSYFVPGIILDHFSYRKSIFWYPKLKILRNFKKFIFDQKIDFLYKNRFLEKKKNDEYEKIQKSKNRSQKLST